MKFKRRIQIITIISLLLVSGMGSVLSGRPVDVFAAELETVSTGDTEASSLPETVSTGDEGTSSAPETVSTGDAGISSAPETVSSGDTEEPSLLDIKVPIDNYDILNVLVPTSYLVAFNPYGLNIRVGEDKVINRQVVSRNYGIINESTRDKLVTLVLTVEDLNDGLITFVDSAEAARNADEETFAIYLALVPADDGEIMINNQNPDKDITVEALTDVSMGLSAENALPLLAGENQVTFKLSGAMYGFIDGVELSMDDEGSQIDSLQFMGLAPDGTGVTAFTFDGVMNPDADWSKLQRGIRISVVYTYEDATGTETIVEGTGALVKVR